MSSTMGDDDQCGRFGAKEVRTCGLPLAAVFKIVSVYYYYYHLSSAA